MDTGRVNERGLRKQTQYLFESSLHHHLNIFTSLLTYHCEKNTKLEDDVN